MKVFSFVRQIVNGFSVIIKDVKELVKRFFVSLKEKFPVFLKWLIWDFSGAHFIYEKINPPLKEEKDKKTYQQPTSFFIWIVGIFFGLASQRYENRVDPKSLCLQVATVNPVFGINDSTTEQLQNSCSLSKRTQFFAIMYVLVSIDSWLAFTSRQ